MARVNKHSISCYTTLFNSYFSFFPLFFGDYCDYSKQLWQKHVCPYGRCKLERKLLLRSIREGQWWDNRLWSVSWAFSRTMRFASLYIAKRQIDNKGQLNVVKFTVVIELYCYSIQVFWSGQRFEWREENKSMLPGHQLMCIGGWLFSLHCSLPMQRMRLVCWVCVAAGSSYPEE